MSKPKTKVIAALVLVGLVLAASALVRATKALSVTNPQADNTMNQNQRKPLDVEAAAEDVIDQADEPGSARERASRQAKNRRYDKKDKGARRLTQMPSGGGVIRGSAAAPGLPLPVADSDSVVIVTVTKAQPFLTQNETGPVHGAKRPR